ncbi:head GIN domain-containing protein [Poritiphilus flavus]|uniref:DUF2807 domain-containing protein n=1 Tax=Poritiphilus flavus TaxID=2697053 RepID=A0A6L9EGZ5_9FLAO|nr:head GIN domain-containing protein [Poritiphilus flavus]NAS13961.1 DUF2807 domain-containing protein [Poritiphilus flavus]
MKSVIRNLGHTTGRQFALAALLIALNACNGDNVPDCFQNAGDIVREEVTVGTFDKITVFEKVRLVLKQDNEQKVEIETGEFLRDEVSAEVEDGRLILRNANNCNLFRDYGLTTVYVSAPNITEIRSSTGLPVESEGILGYNSLDLISESFSNPETETTDGSFELDVNTDELAIEVNGINFFQLRGNVSDFSVFIAAGDSRVEAQQLTAQNVRINHRGSNDILVNPQESLTGVIRGTGDVISINRPDSVDVEVLFRGRLIFSEQ